ncbi:MAG: hypothetical protein BWY11_01762 [Firmicutes bacterium ADurb.Bin182]|nr:MAG: hypothetical protein BWY11_01762 [Firmicutes bacterium ADurb.Bin182]
MEILYNEASLNRIAGSAAAQAMVESDIPLPEAHRDAVRVLDADGSVNVDNVEVLEGRFMLEGSLKVKLICLDTDGTAFAFESSSTFKNTAAVEGAEPGMSYYCKPELLELSCEPMGGSIRLSATVEFICRALDNTPIRTLGGIRGANDIEMLTREVNTALEETAGEAVFRMREEIASAGVSNVIAHNSNAAVREVTEQENSAAVEGTLTFNALCSNSEGELTQLVQHLPFGELVDIDPHRRGPLSAKANVEQLTIRPVGDEFGILAVEAQIKVTVNSLSSKSGMLPVDAYSPSRPFICNTDNIDVYRAQEPMQKRVVLRESASVPAGSPDIYRIVFAKGRPVVTGSDVINGQMKVEGMLFTTVIYTSDNNGLESFTEDIPFIMDMDVPRNTTDADIDVKCMSVSGSGAGRTAELSIVLEVTADPYEIEEVSVVRDAAEGGEQTPVRGIIVYFAGAGETLFDVAKRFRTTREALREANGDLPEHLSEGQKLLLFLRRNG